MVKMLSKILCLLLILPITLVCNDDFKTCVYTGDFDDFDNGYTGMNSLKVIKSYNGEGYDMEVYLDSTLSYVYLDNLLYRTGPGLVPKSITLGDLSAEPTFINMLVYYHIMELSDFVDMLVDKGYIFRDRSEEGARKVKKAYDCEIFEKTEYEKTTGNIDYRNIYLHFLPEYDFSQDSMYFDLFVGEIKINRFEILKENRTYYNDNDDSIGVYNDYVSLSYYDTLKRSGSIKYRSLFLMQDGSVQRKTCKINRNNFSVFRFTTNTIDTIPYKKIKLPAISK